MIITLVYKISFLLWTR